MKEFFLLIVGAALVNNFVLTYFLGLCPFMGSSKRLSSAFGMSLATGFVLTLASALSYVVHQYLLIPLDVEYLRIIAFILIIAAIVQFTELYLRSTNPVLHAALGMYLPLITTNCAVLGVALLNLREGHGFVESLFFGFGAAAGFSLVLVLFSALRERLELSNPPAAFRGSALALVSAGLMSLAFMGFSGLAPV